MSHAKIHSDLAPAALGPYSQAIGLDASGRRLLFLAGQTPLDPATGQLVEGPIEAQVERVMQNLGAVLKAAGSGFDRVLKTTIFLADLNDFAAVNAAYGRYFGNTPPARSTVQVSRLPKDARVEIEAIAYV